MRTNLSFCLLVYITVSVSTGNAGVILTTGDWTLNCQSGDAGVTGGTGDSSASAHAYGDSDYYSYAGAEGWQSTYTSEVEYRQWWYRVYVWAEAEVVMWSGQPCTAYADAYANAYPPNPQDSRQLSAAASVQSQGWGGTVEDDDGGDTVFMSGTDQFGPTTDLYCSHGVGACTIVTQYTSDQALAHACGRAYGGLN
jgi:hypothetical protein